MFIEQPFAGGTGGVSEDRYEGLLSFGRKLTDKLNFQIIAGAEHSTITQTGIERADAQLFPAQGIGLAGVDAVARFRRVGEIAPPGAAIVLL